MTQIARRICTVCVMLAACALLAHAQPPDASNKRPPRVTLNVAALDAKDHPVTDLTSGDFQIFDDGKLQHITSFKARAAQPAAANPPPTMVILFDLLNSVPGHREYMSNLIIRALEPMETGDSVYLYLLTNHGDLYPVHALPSPPRARDTEESGKPASVPWTRHIHPLLDGAIQSVFGLRPVDDKDRGVRSVTTFRTLGDLGEQLTEIPGSKTIIWITAGVENWIAYPYGCRDVNFPEGSGGYLAAKCNGDCSKFRGGQCIDFTPFLHRFSAELERTGTVLYSVQETAVGSLPPADRGSAQDTLQQLANLTGGQIYSDGEVEKAISQSLEDVRARYQLAYDAPPADGKYHKLRVACTRKGVRIQTQRGYFADQP